MLCADSCHYPETFVSLSIKKFDFRTDFFEGLLIFVSFSFCPSNL